MKRQKATATPLSDFVRNTSSGEKKKVYEGVLRSASNLQNVLIEQSRKTVCS
jgi:hypothetical protein